MENSPTPFLMPEQHPILMHDSEAREYFADLQRQIDEHNTRFAAVVQ
jgi:murein L,D-transpeptidase YcbB/YkuD